jgi:hypothetical protein
VNLEERYQRLRKAIQARLRGDVDEWPVLRDLIRHELASAPHGVTTPSLRELADRTHAIGKRLSELARGPRGELDHVEVDRHGQELRYIVGWLHGAAGAK